MSAENKSASLSQAATYRERLYDVRQAGRKGCGLFATKQILAETTIAQSRAMICGAEDFELVSKTHLWPFVFVFRSTHGGVTEIEHCALVFGDISFCNHSGKPNATLVWTHCSESTALVDLKALIDIGKDDEIRIRYADVDTYVSRGIEMIE